MTRCILAVWVVGLLFSALQPSAQARIQGSVGLGGQNAKNDVKTVQTLLNSISDLSGGPTERLNEDGKIGPKTIAAIKRFQQMQLGFQDGRIDPGQKTELRLLRLNGKHVLLGAADSDVEKKLAEFTSTFANVVVSVDGKKISVRPPYHINAGDRKARALANRKANPKVAKLITDSVGREAQVGKATPTQIRTFLQAAVKAKVVSPNPDEMRALLSKYGVSTDCSGLASRACNLLKPDNPLDVVNRANTAHLATLTPVASPSDLQAGDLMVKGGSHVRLVTDVDVTPGGIEFTTLESTASNVFPNGNGIGERRWRFVDIREFKQLQEKKGGRFVDASAANRSYIYTSK